MAIRQRALIVTTPIPAEGGRLAALREALAAIDKCTGTDPFRRLRTVHFLRWTILEERPASSDATAPPDACEPFGPALLLTTVFDGPLRAHLSELGTVLESEFRKVYGTFIDGAQDWEGHRFARLLRSGRVRPGLFFNGTLYRSRDQIDLERRGWDRIQQELDKLSRPSRGSQIDRARKDPVSWLRRQMNASNTPRPGLRRRLNDSDAPPWLRQWGRRPDLPLPPRPLLEGLGLLIVLTGLASLFYLGTTSGAEAVRLGLARILTALVVLFIVLGSLHAALFRAVERQERRELARGPTEPGCVPNHGDGAHPSAREAMSELNEVTHLAPIKPGWVRLWTLRIVLFWLNLATRLYAARALHLGRITTIHFGYWTILKGPRRLLFVSHYDGTFENYLEDFALLDTHYGVNAIWSHCVGFPLTRPVFRGGAREEIREFVEFGRRFQHAAQVWYRAYPDLPAAHINRNTLVRQGLVARRRWFGLRRRPSADDDWAIIRQMT